MGDPAMRRVQAEEYRRVAGRFRAYVRDIDEESRSLHRRAESMEYVGPAATRFRVRMRRRRQAAKGVAEGLDTLAEYLLMQARRAEREAAGAG